ncbi:MAG: segregation and condensation protein A [Methanomassiliicoccales archaeon PtaU1.Bin124]|nr:MAG: segregation and condensation protein A [Methanomassiliicoccales archaeon PtaU1.Bin124]
MSDTSSEAVLGHLLFHRAIIDEGDRSEKIERYMQLLKQAEMGEHVVPTDPIDRSIQLVFELVLSQNFDPWDVNLMEFTRLYTKKMHSDEINFIVAGKLMWMAWSIFRMQSKEVLTLHEQPEEFELVTAEWDMDMLDQLSEEEALSVINTKIPAGVELSPAVRHHTSRPVMLVELLDAFDDAQREMEIQEQRQKVKEKLAKLNIKFDGKAHSEDLEKDVQMTWERIMRCGNGPVHFEDLVEGGKEDAVTIFVSLLFLAKAGKVALWQDELPYGQIFLEIKLPWDIGTLEDSAVGRVPAVVRPAVM